MQLIIKIFLFFQLEIICVSRFFFIEKVLTLHIYEGPSQRVNKTFTPKKFNKWTYCVQINKSIVNKFFYQCEKKNHFPSHHWNWKVIFNFKMKCLSFYFKIWNPCKSCFLSINIKFAKINKSVIILAQFFFLV